MTHFSKTLGEDCFYKDENDDTLKREIREVIFTFNFVNKSNAIVAMATTMGAKRQKPIPRSKKLKK